MAKRPSLGRGLAALLPEPATAIGILVQEIPLERITANPYQPRLHFDPAQLQELADSIRQHGVIQPILVVETGEGYQLVAGERRVQASRLAGLATIPAQVRHYDDRTILALALVENVQRAELDPIEKARALARLKEEFGATQEELAKEIGVSRPQVANLLRLLALPESVQAHIQAGNLTLGHAKVLLSLDGTELVRYADTCVSHGWSVRELEYGISRCWIDGPPPEPMATVAKARAQAGSDPAPRPQAVATDPDLARTERQLSEHFGTPVKIHVRGGKSGAIALQFYSWEDADRLIRRLLSAQGGGG